MKYQYRTWYYKPQSPESWAHFVYVYEIDYLRDKNYKVGYGLVASNDLKGYKDQMTFEATNDLDYWDDEKYKKVPDNIVKKLKVLMFNANRIYVVDIFK